MATKKEQMVMNLINRRNYFRTLMGDKLLEYSEYEIASEARKNSAVELEKQLESIEKSINLLETKRAADKYWAEHPEEKQQLEAKKEELINMYQTIGERYTDRFNQLVEPYEMTVKYISTTNVELKSTLKDRYGFELYYHRNWNINRETREVEASNILEINYPCYGSFNPVQEPEMVKYLMALASISSNQYLFKSFEQLFVEYNKEMEEIKELVKNVKAQIENPLQ